MSDLPPIVVPKFKLVWGACFATPKALFRGGLARLSGSQGLVIGSSRNCAVAPDCTPFATVQ